MSKLGHQHVEAQPLPGSSWMAFSRQCSIKLEEVAHVRKSGGLSAPGVAEALEKARAAATAAAARAE